MTQAAIELQCHGASEIGLAAFDPCAEQDAGERGEKRAYDIGEEERGLGVDAREIGGLDVAADRVDTHTEPRPVHEHPHHRDGEKRDKDRNRNAEYRAEAEEIPEFIGQIADRDAAGDEQRDTGADGLHA